MTGSVLDSDRTCVNKSVEANMDDIPDVISRIDLMTEFLRTQEAKFRDLEYLKVEMCNLIIRGIDEISFFVKNTAWKCHTTQFAPPHKVH